MRIFLVTLFFTACLSGFILFGCGDPAARIHTVSSESSDPIVTKIMFFGDSLTDAPNVELNDRYPSVAERSLAAQGFRVHAIHEGKGGNTTADGLDRIDAALATHQPDIMFLCLGGNDFLHVFHQVMASRFMSFSSSMNAEFKERAETARNNLRELIRRAKARGIKVVVAGLQIPESVLAKAIDMLGLVGLNPIQQFQGIFKQAADAEGAHFMPSLLKGIPPGGFFDKFNLHILDPEYMNTGDRIHPNSKGHKIMGEEVAEFLAELGV